MNLDRHLAAVAPGTTGALFDDTPRLTTAAVRPFVWAILMFRTGVHSWEVVNALSAVCSTEDMKAESENLDDDRTAAEILVDQVLGEMTAEGLLDYNDEKDIWVLRYSHQAVPVVITAVAGVNGRMPQHFLFEMEKANA